MGDAFDSRKGVDYSALEWAQTYIFNPLRDYEVHLIAGNHDCYYKSHNDTNSIEVLLKEYENIATYSRPSTVMLQGDCPVVLLPWVSADLKAEAIESLKDTVKYPGDYLFGHLELDGFSPYKGMTFTSSSKDRFGSLSNRALFDRFKKVFSGHFHTRSDDGHIFYIGNPYEIRWNDVHDQRGFMLFETETGKCKYVNNPYTLFDILEWTENEEENLKLKVEPYINKFIQLRVSSKPDPVTLYSYVSRLTEAGALGVKVVDNSMMREEEGVEVDTSLVNEDTMALITKYLNVAEIESQGLNPKRIQQLIADIYTEASI